MLEDPTLWNDRERAETLGRERARLFVDPRVVGEFVEYQHAYFHIFSHWRAVKPPLFH